MIAAPEAANSSPTPVAKVVDASASNAATYLGNCCERLEPFVAGLDGGSDVLAKSEM